MTSPPFQFTLRRMLVAVGYTSAAFGIAGWILRLWQQVSQPIPASLAILSFCAPFAIFALIGASLGELCGNAWKGTKQGLDAPFYLAALVLIVVAGVLAIGGIMKFAGF